MKEEKKTLKFVVCDACGVFLDGGAGLCSYKCKYDGASHYERPLREETYQLVKSVIIKQRKTSPRTQ
jgi:hypothetical protein